MTRFRCFSCNRPDFHSQRGLSVHRAKCAKKSGFPMAAALGEKRRRNNRGRQRRSVTVPSGIDSGADPSPSTIVEPPLGPDPRPEGCGSRSGCTIRIVPSQCEDSPARQPEQSPNDATLPNPPPKAGPMTFKTGPNERGVGRVYPVKSSTDSDTIGADVEHAHEIPNRTVGTSHTPGDQPFYAPFSNPSVFRLMSWHYDGSTTYNMETLITDVLKAPDFHLQDLVGFSAEREAKRFKAYQRSIAPGARFFDDEELEGIDGEHLGPEDGEDNENVDGDVVYDHED